MKSSAFATSASSTSISQVRFAEYGHSIDTRMFACFEEASTVLASNVRPGTIVGFAVWVWSPSAAYEIDAPRETPSTRAR
jgi:hypothetical protein